MTTRQRIFLFFILTIGFGGASFWMISYGDAAGSASFAFLAGMSLAGLIR